MRHACAGRKQDWDGPDDERPLDTVGSLQADALVGLFAVRTVARVLSSPTRRCLDTVAPLARHHGLAVEAVEELRTGVELPVLLQLLLRAEHRGAVLCTHGEVMQLLLPVLEGCDSLPPEGVVDRERLLAKGVVWTLQLSEDPATPIAGLRYRMPDAPHTCTVHDGGGAGAGTPLV